MSWQQNAACKGMNPDIFYEPRHAARALITCWSCPVQEQCGEHAEVAEEEYGVWGGYTAEERWQLGMHTRRQYRYTAPCGTETAYRRHLRNDEQPCDACQDAAQIAAAERYKRRGNQEAAS